MMDGGRSDQGPAKSKWHALLVGGMLALVAACVPVSDATVIQTPSDHEHEHDHEHDHSLRITYRQALLRLANHRQAIETAFDAGTPAACHEPLHAALELLTRFPEIAANTDLEKEDWQSVCSAANAIATVFRQIDQQIHGNSDVATLDLQRALREVDQNMAQLRAKTELTGEVARERPAEFYGDEGDEHQVEARSFGADTLPAEEAQ